jgi:hypothetical protein
VKRLKNWLGDQLRTEIEVIDYSQKIQSKTSTHHLKDFFYTSLPIFIRVTFTQVNILSVVLISRNVHAKQKRHSSI